MYPHVCCLNPYSISLKPRKNPPAPVFLKNHVQHLCFTWGARARTTGQQFDEPRLALHGAAKVGDGNGGLGNCGIFLQLCHDIGLEGKDPQLNWFSMGISSYNISGYDN